MSILTSGAWRGAVILALYLTVFEGAIRKWALPQRQELVYFAKDAVLVWAYLGFVTECRMHARPIVQRHPANIALFLLLLLSLLELTNPALQHIYVGLLGLKAYWMYAPLLYMTPYMFRDDQLTTFWRRFVIMSSVPLLLGFIQFTSPADSLVNRYAWTDAEAMPGVATFGTFTNVRIAGTFAFITGYTTYLTLIIIITTCLAVSARTRRAQWLHYGLLGLALVNVYMTGSRGPFIVLGVALPILLQAAYRYGGSRRLRALWTVVVVVPLVLFAVNAYAPDARDAFARRSADNNDVPARIVAIVSQPVWAIGQSGPWGYGIGSTHQAAFAVLRSQGITTSGVNAPPPAEGEWERIILEMGPIGFILSLVVRIAVSVQLWRAFRRLRGRREQFLVLGAFCFSLTLLVQPIVFNHIASIFYWTVAGFGLFESTTRAAAHTTGRPDANWANDVRRGMSSARAY